MQLQFIYQKDINRSINGVIKVAQDDESVIEQELQEYIITKELRRHFNTFLNAYERSLSIPTDKIGVWISGFFGSGKSHFLKILSYLLENDIVAGKHAVDYFANKFDDPMMFAQLEACARIPTDTILFNIDSKSSIVKDKTAILKVFTKVFYEYRGFYGDDLKIARLEQFIEKSGKEEQFKAKFEEINGDTWENARSALAFFEDDIVDTMVETLDMSETAARNWFNSSDTTEYSIEQLVKEIKEYIDSKGKNFRLIFLIDEVGQYIGSDGSLMLNLQTIVEEIGAKCGGRVWVVVTSQEAIDSVTKISGDDFSKIQGRFNTRLSLSSSSVDEVIKRRILAKTSDAENLLRMVYDENSAILKNLFTFNDAVADLKGYAGENDFVETYPFVPYQFRLMQNVLAQIRKHGNSGKHLSGGERSMLSGFQEAAQAIQNKDENALVPFSLFYNTVHTFLDSTIRRVIDRCQTAADNHDGIEQYDVDILKLLYLIRYVDDVKANVDNITTLMVEDIRADKINMRKAVQESLDRLLSQNYISRNGDTYTFLTDEEQEIAREIRNIPVDSAEIIKSIADTIFGDLYPNKKFKYGKYDFSFDQMVDETAIGIQTGAIKLHILTAASDLYNGGDQRLIHQSSSGNEALFVLSDEYPYFEELEQAKKIRKYIKSRNVSQLPEATQHIIHNYQQQAGQNEKRARELLTNAILSARVFAAGEMISPRASGVKDKFEYALASLVEKVYTKLSYIRHHFDSDEELLRIIIERNDQRTLDGGMAIHNPEAVDEIEQYLQIQEQKYLPTSMGDIHNRFSGIPYGWREIDIAAAVISLIAAQKVTLTYSGNQIQPGDKHLPDYLRKKTEINKSIISRRVAIPDAVLKNARKFLKEYFNVMDLPDDEDGLIAYITGNFTAEKEKFQNLLNHEYAFGNYPGRSVVEEGIARCTELLSQKKDNLALLNKMKALEDDFLDLRDEMADVKAFFSGQKSIYDSAASLLKKMRAESEYLRGDESVMQSLDKIESILKNPRPYRMIKDLPELCQKVKASYSGLLRLKQDDVLGDIQAAMAEIHQTAKDDPQSRKIVDTADKELATRKNDALSSEIMTELDAMRSRIDGIRKKYLQQLLAVGEPVHVQDILTVTRGSLFYSQKLENDEDIEEYTEELKAKLSDLLKGHDAIHII